MRRVAARCATVCVVGIVSLVPAAAQTPISYNLLGYPLPPPITVTTTSTYATGAGANPGLTPSSAKKSNPRDGILGTYPVSMRRLTAPDRSAKTRRMSRSIPLRTPARMSVSRSEMATRSSGFGFA